MGPTEISKKCLECPPELPRPGCVWRDRTIPAASEAARPTGKILATNNEYAE